MQGLARIKKHEEALEVCDHAIELATLTNTIEGLFLDPTKLADAYRQEEKRTWQTMTTV